MRECINDPFYELIKKHDRCVVSYCIMESGAPHRGEPSHRDAVLYAMLKMIERSIEEDLETEAKWNVPVPLFPWTLDIAKAEAAPIDPPRFCLCRRSCARTGTEWCSTTPTGRRMMRIAAVVSRIGTPFWSRRTERMTRRMICAKSTPRCFRRAPMRLKCMNGPRTGRTISTQVTNGGALRAGLCTMRI